MIIQHNSKSLSTGAVSMTQDPRSWQNEPAKPRGAVTASISDRKEQGGHNIPPSEPKPKND